MYILFISMAFAGLLGRAAGQHLHIPATGFLLPGWSGAALCLSFIAAAAEWACVWFSGIEYVYPFLRGEVASNRITSAKIHHHGGCSMLEQGGLPLK